MSVVSYIVVFSAALLGVLAGAMCVVLSQVMVSLLEIRIERKANELTGKTTLEETK